MRSVSGKISILIICLMVGIMLAIQFKTSQSIDINLRGTRVDEMAYKNSVLVQERDASRKEVVTLREKLTNMENGSSQVTSDLQDELKKANIAAGLSAVQGPGIVVTLNDNPRALQLGEDPNNSLVHDVDVLKIVNEMKASGAEAISVNGERITSMSEIRCAGTTILVNMNKVAPPFVIKATGNPQLLESGLSIRGGELEQLATWGLQTKLERLDKIEIPAFNGVLKFIYSDPVQSKEKAE